MDGQFKVGDVVQVKSGGPRMTIDCIGKFGMGNTHDQARCVWFEGTKQMEHVFEFAALMPATNQISQVAVRRG